MNYDFHKLYFENRALNQIDFVNLTDVDRLIELNYELHILDLIKKGHVINEKLDFESIDDSREQSNGDVYFEESSLTNDGLNRFTRNKLVKLNRTQKDKKSNTFCKQLHNYFEQLNSNRSNTDQKSNVDSKLSHVLYISMNHEQDFDNWFSIASCFNLWDLMGDPRGMHKGVY